MEWTLCVEARVKHRREGTRGGGACCVRHSGQEAAGAE